MSQPLNLSRTPSPFFASDYTHDGKKHLLLAATGSVAAIKIPQILSALSSYQSTLSVRLILAPSATHFLSGLSDEQPTPSSIFSSTPNLEGIHTDDDEWTPLWVRGSPVLHIELRKWADVMLIAPLSASGMTKMVQGWSDGLVYSVLRAWDTDGTVDMRGVRTVVVAPAMNTAMWRHPVTKEQLRVLEKEWEWVHVLRPVEKPLACGDVGEGAMIEWVEVVRVVKDMLSLPKVDQD